MLIPPLISLAATRRTGKTDSQSGGGFSVRTPDEPWRDLVIDNPGI